jgi:alpha-mannosidase
MNKSISIVSTFLFFSIFNLSSQTQVTIERSDSLWKFPTIPRPSRSDIARDSKITIVGNDPEFSCLSPDGLHNGVLPWEGKQTRDFFAFSNYNTNSGKIVMDLGKIQPIMAIITYSWQGKYECSRNNGGFNGNDKIINDGLNGGRAPQFYSLYGSNAEKPNSDDLYGKDWIKIADVDTRPNKTGKNWDGQYASSIKGKNSALLGNFRWLAWDVKHTLKPGQTPEWTGTWYTELDVHTPETYKKAGDAVMAGSDLDEIILSFKTHFDIGFTHPAPEIVNIYRTSMIDNALGIIDESLKLPPDKRFSWTIPSWVMYQILWDGQDTVRKERVIKAVKEGSLVVHGLPITFQSEGLELEDLVAGLSINRKISKELGIPMSRAGKMTDVPSHSWILPTLLKNAGIDFLHIGVNSCNERPDVPLLYNWEGPDGSILLTMHNQGYGSDEEQGKGLYPPKDWPYKHWLAMIMTSDNQGPPSQQQVQELLSEAKRNLPDVKIKLGKMEDFADAIVSEEKSGAKVPVIHSDMPDCWIHGAGTMPSMENIAHKTRTEITAVESLDEYLKIWGITRPDIKKELFHAHEKSLMYGEHTWGGSRNLEGQNAYSDKNFEKDIQTDENCKWLQKTWDDHADYIKKSDSITMKLLKDELKQLSENVDVDGKRIVIFNPLPYSRDAIVEIPGHEGQKFLAKNLPPGGYKTWKLNEVLNKTKSEFTFSDKVILENAFLKVSIDKVKGGIISIVDKKTNRELVDSKAKYAFGQYLYQRFDRTQTKAYDLGCEHIDSYYGFCARWNIRADIPENVPYIESVPSFTKMKVCKNDLIQTAELTADASDIITSKVTILITLPFNSPWFEIAIRIDDKKPDYWPENGSFYLPVKAEHPQFRIGRIGAVVDPTKDFAIGSNRTYGYVNTGAMITDADGVGLGICPLDHRIMSFGEKGIYTIDPVYVPKTSLCSVSIFNNLWTINFPYWIEGTIVSRVRIWAIHDLKPSNLIEPAMEAQYPVFAVIADGVKGNLPESASGLKFSRPGISLISYQSNPDGKGTILRIWEQVGKSSILMVTFPNGAKYTTATAVNLRGDILGKPISISNRTLKFYIHSYAPSSFVLE